MQPLSSLINLPGYGKPISSHSARYASRYFRNVIAVLVVTIVIISTISALPEVSLVLIGTCIGLYIIYTVMRQKLGENLERRWYKPRLQLIRGQLGIFAATLLYYYFSSRGHPNTIWLLSLLPLLIISEHCDTLTLVLSLIETGMLIAGVHLIIGGKSQTLVLADFIDALSQILWLGIFSFILHYLVRNVQGRELAIQAYRDGLTRVTENLLGKPDPGEIRKTMLEYSLTLLESSAGSFWKFDPARDCLQRVAGWAFRGKTHEILQQQESEHYESSLTADSSTLPAHVIRTKRAGKVGVEGKSKKLSGFLPFPPLLPDSFAELAVPLFANSKNRSEPDGVLCLSFREKKTLEELDQTQRKAEELMRDIAPILIHANELEQHNIQRGLEKHLRQTLDVDTVVKDLVDAATTVVGFDFAVVSLVDEERNIIRAIWASPNVPREWVELSSHSLNSRDIQADIVRKGQTEILRGADERFDKKIWRRFGHQEMLRAFIPMSHCDHDQRSTIGVLEVGYFVSLHRRITEEQLDLLSPAIEHAAITINHANQYLTMRRKAEALTSLHKATQELQTITTKLQLQRVLRSIGENAEKILDADLIMLYECDPSKKLSLAYMGGTLWGKGSLSLSIEPGNVLEKIISSKEPHYSRDARSDPRLVGYHSDLVEGVRRQTFTQRQNIKSFAGVPLVSEQRVIGVLCVNYRSRRQFGSVETEILDLFARQAALAMENARLYDFARESATKLERDRLSRELHLSVSQEVFGLELKTQAALNLLWQNEKEAERQLLGIKEIARSIESQIGYLISELRSKPEQEDLPTALGQYGERLRRYFDLNIELDGPSSLPLSPDTQGTVINIAREALNNVARHAKCKNVKISYKCNNHEFHMIISDDGVGFDESTLKPSDKYGIQSMYEYAEVINARMKLESAPGQGTCLELALAWNPQ